MRSILRSVLLTCIFLSVIPASASAFPGANGKIAFSTNRGSAGDYEIFVMNADGSGQTNLTKNDADDRGPASSSDAAKIAFSTDRDGNDEVYVMNADGSGQANLTKNDADDDGPAWSPDGTKIAFQTERNPNNDEIFVMDADGSGQTNLTNNSAYDSEPAWSPDGTKIAFTTDRGFGGGHDIYVMNADGGDPTRLTDDPAYDAYPAWSPDGTKIAFATTRDGGYYGIYVMNADGGSETKLTTSVHGHVSPVWSPDGTKIAFTRYSGEPEIYVMSADGANQTNLTKSGANDVSPDWEPLAPPGSSPGSGPLLPTDTTLPLADAARPRLSRLSLTNKLFRYTLSEAAGVTFVIQRKLAGRRVAGKCRKPTPRNRSPRTCARYKTVGRLAQDGVAGRNAKPFSRRLKGRKLKPGRYRAQLTAQDAAGNRSNSASVAFRVTAG